VVGIREMGQAKLEKLQKARLVEAINACMAHINLLESDKPPADDFKLIFVNADDGNTPAYTQDTQDYMDRADTGWDAILKLAAEQTLNAVTPPFTVASPVAANVAVNAPHALLCPSRGGE
jgi:hypothetical protein